MTVARRLYFSLFFVFLFGCYTAGEPPYMWYSTYSINDYTGNGDCGRGNLSKAHQEAAAFSAALESIILQFTTTQVQYCHRRVDPQCMAYRWTGEDAEVNKVDFAFYAGHGCGKGPVFGCNPGYPIYCKDDIRFGGNHYLKWVMAVSCSWFAPPEHDGCNTGLSVKVRWLPCLKGVHAIMGHQAVTWEHEFMEEVAIQFWYNWTVVGVDLCDAWIESQGYWVFEEGKNYGLFPTVLAPGEQWGREKFANAVDALAPSPADTSEVWVYGREYGTPLY